MNDEQFDQLMRSVRSIQVGVYALLFCVGVALGIAFMEFVFG